MDVNHILVIATTDNIQSSVVSRSSMAPSCGRYTLSNIDLFAGKANLGVLGIS